MGRIGHFDGFENPEQKNPNKEASENKQPTDIDKKKLERPNSNVEHRKRIDENKDAKRKLPTENNISEGQEKRNPEKMDATVNDYFGDLKKRSDYPNTIKDHPFESSDLKKLSPEETAAKRDEFDDKKDDLKKQWEHDNKCSWPKYKEDVYSPNGKLIRKAGGDYDAHHIQPLGMNGKNEASNITPLHAKEHYDKQGVHAPDSPYSKLDKML